MSKRVADGQGGAERYGNMEDPRDVPMDPPRKATAAQLAKRSIRPLKGRPGSTSRASSPSKTTAAQSFSNPFGAGAPPADSNPWALNASAPPDASSFSFSNTSSAQPSQGNPFASTSQSFPPAAPPNANGVVGFSLAPSQQPASSPSFAPPQSSSFNFSAAAPSGTSFNFGATPAQSNGDANKAPSFTFGSTPASQGPSGPASPAPIFAFSGMPGPSFGGEKAISAAEIREIEAAGPRLSQEGKLEALANIVRHSEPKYKDADLGGLDLSSLPPAVQKKMLNYVRSVTESVSNRRISSFVVGESRYDVANGPGDSNDVPQFASHMPKIYTKLPSFSEQYFLVNGCIDEMGLAQAAADPHMPGEWQTGIAALQSRLDEEKTGLAPMHSYTYFDSAPTTFDNLAPESSTFVQPSTFDKLAQENSTFVQPSAASFDANAFAYSQPYQPYNSVEDSFVNHPDVELDTQHEMLDVTYSTADNEPQAFPNFRPLANYEPYQTQVEPPQTSFSFPSTMAAPSAPASTSFNFGTTSTNAAPSSGGFHFASTAEQKADSPSAFGGFGPSTTAAASSNASPASFNFASSPAPAPSPAFNFATQQPATPAPAAAFHLGPSATPAAPPSPKLAEKKLPSFAFSSPAAPKPAERSVSYPSLTNASSSQESAPAPTPVSAFGFGQSTASSPFKAPIAPESPRPHKAGLGSSMFNSAPTLQKPVESAFKGFGAPTPAPSQAAAPSSAFGSSQAQAPAPPGRAQPPFSKSTGVATPPPSPMLKPADLASALIKQLNESLRAHLATADASQDWSSILRYYFDQIADIHGEDSGAPSATAIAAPDAPKRIAAPLLPTNPRGEKRAADEEIVKEDDHSKRSKMSSSISTTPTKPLSTTASLFDDILNSAEKPKTPQQANVFAAPAPPATAPQAKSNPFSTITRKVSATPAPTSKASFVMPKPSAAPAPSPFQIKPANSTSGNAPASGFSVPKFGNAAATGTAPSFIGSFGKKAADEEAKALQKRKEEDMDSDEDEEEWERRDAEKQAAKKAELLAASQAVKFSVDTSKKGDSAASATFSFSGAPSFKASASSNMFGNLSSSKIDEQEDDDDEEGDTEEDEDVHAALTQASSTNPNAGKSLFERVSFDTDKDKTADTPSASFKFSSFGSSGAAGDNTWKGSNPIKFGTSTTTAGTTTPDGSPVKASSGSVLNNTPAPAPTFSFGAMSNSTSNGEKSSPFGGVFATKSADTPKTSGSMFGSTAPSGLAPPSGSSVFASATTSRATTPGTATTDAEGSAADDEENDTTNDKQQDLTALTADDLANYDLVHESRCKVTKFVKGENTWVPQGLGPVRILASKETLKPRVLMRADPSGKVSLNFNALLNKDLYTQMNVKMVRVSVPAEDKKLESYMCMFKDEAKAKAFVDALHEAISTAQS